MNDATSFLVSAVSALAGIVAAGFQVVATRRFRVRRELEEAQLTAARLDTALESADISKLGTYLFETVGSVRLSDIASEGDLQARVAKALELVSAYTKTDEREAVPDSPEISLPPVTGHSQELERARQSAIAGEIWNGLARARLYLERALISRLDLDDSGPGGASRLLFIALGQGVIDQADANALRYAINVANKGVHGEDVDLRVALEVIDIIERVLLRE